jgi:hypothetical protein
MIGFLRSIFGFAVFFIGLAVVIYVGILLFSLEDTKLGISLGISYILTVLLYIGYICALSTKERG